MNRHGRRWRGLVQWIASRDWPVRKIIQISGIALLAVVLVQLLWPKGRALPGVSVDALGVGGKTTTTIQKELDALYKNAQLTVVTGAKKSTISFGEAGIDPQSKETAQAATDYKLGWRFVPFSSVFIGSSRHTPMQAGFDDDRLKYTAEQMSKAAYVAPQNAGITVASGKVELVPAKPSQSYDTNKIIKGIKSSNLAPRATITVKSQEKEAPRSDSEVKAVLQKAQKAVDTPLSFSVNNQTVTASKATIGSWLDFPEDPKTKMLSLSVNAEVLKKYLADNIQSKVYKAPGTTTVTVVDDVETGRVTGADGRGVDADKVVSLVNGALQSGKKTTVSVPVTSLPPSVVYKRSYSKTSAGLTALLNDIAGSKGFGVSVVTMYGASLSASANGSKQFEAASTYKLFIAYVVFQRINQGAMQWSDQIYGGRDATTCFDDMIVKSDNNCAKAFADKVGGWQAAEDAMRGLGLTGTDLTGSTLLTTSNDLALYLQKLQSGTLLNAADTGRLIDAMKRQIYRSGIPKGTGQTVADKVGFVDNVIHDAGIVYGPNGPYILVVMTSNSSWSAIANIAAQINTYLN
ncbi:MAG TPA: serine hydrolase [Candidatus Saccharimonadales bacterium]|nr:serine hydrolase [Candidatus Saccharimonadales bacterium]